MEYKLHFPKNVVFGEDTLKQIGELTKEFGNKCLAVVGAGSLKKAGHLQKIRNNLNINGIKLENVFPVNGEPNCSMVDEARKIAEQEKVSFIVGVGGGSVLDVAKAAAGLFGQELSTADYVNKAPFTYRGIPFIAVPTTAGTGSEITLNSVLYNPLQGNKTSIAHPKFQAALSIIDPVLTYTMPAAVTASSGMDALTHAIESYTSTVANPVTMGLAEKAIELIGSSLLKAVDSGTDQEARANMVMGSMIAALAFAQTGVGIAHAISHPLGAIFHIPHGVANAILLGEAIAYNEQACSEKYRKIAKLMGTDKKLDLYVKDILKSLPIPHSLNEAGYTQGREDEIIEKAFQSRSLKKNPRKVAKEDILKVIDKCL